jgi:hypothetical protein
MAESRKSKRQTESRQRKTSTASSRPAESREASPTVPESLTSDGLLREWALHHPDRPEIRARLERLFRQSG